jgi:Zn finger protein HypA/HybF involved in hydrogenase expression
MGTGYKVHCTCGYQGTADVGSTRAMLNKEDWFPFRCNQCKKLVDVDLLSNNMICPECKSADLTSCEPTTKRCRDWLGKLLGPRLRQRFGLHLRDDEIQENYCWQLKKNFILMREGNICPQCKQPNMRYVLDCMFD